MTQEDRIDAVAEQIARNRGARHSKDFTREERDEARCFVELYDVLRRIDKESETVLSEGKP